MSRGDVILLSSAAIALIYTEIHLSMRGIKPSPRKGILDRIYWESFPKDEQTRTYLRERLKIGAISFATSILVLVLVGYLYDKLFLN
ncbi:MAG: hypothetical protein A4S14_02395 [Proteobacteria bacterium SG_bin9]|nr:MAG: hypothetical protein A4S14_02395 [Proteobacteria bacterium SG_bin9]